MKTINKKLSLNDLKVESFITSIHSQKSNTIKAGSNTVTTLTATLTRTGGPNPSVDAAQCIESIIKTLDTKIKSGGSDNGPACMLGGDGNTLTGSGNAEVCNNPEGEVHSGFDGVGCANSDYEINGACQ